MTSPLQEDYRVTLEAFEGPLDLLLFLIRRAEVDITEIPIAGITDQYLAFLTAVDDVDVEVAGEFLVMAATLIELKSRSLMPPEDAPGSAASAAGDAIGAPPGDPRSELVQQLLAYQRVRIAAEELDERRQSFALRYPIRPARAGAAAEGDEPETAEPVELELEDVHVMDLAEAYEQLMASIDFTRLGDHVVEIDDTPIALHQEDLLDRLTRADRGRLSLPDVFAGQTPGQRVGLFLATLELARQRRVTILQEEIDGAIEVVLREEEATERRSDEATEGGGSEEATERGRD